MKNLNAVIQGIDVNTADTSALLLHYPALVVNWKSSVLLTSEINCGFYKTEQVAETFGLPDSTFNKIKSRLVLNNTVAKQFNINTATVDEMKAHPYIRYNIANAIVQYRIQHGNFLSVADIKKIMMITDEVYNKVSPYLSL